MNTQLLTGTIGALLLLSPLTYAQEQKPSPAKTAQGKGSGMSQDMRQAIAWEHAKDRAAARQERIEARRSRADQSADRMTDDKETSRKVKDTKDPGAKRDGLAATTGRSEFRLCARAGRIRCGTGQQAFQE
jgi:hypothetical protein